MYCKFCGKSISDDSIFCSYCGKYRSEEDTRATDATDEEKTEPSEETNNIGLIQKLKQSYKKDKLIWVVSIIIVSVLVSLLIGITIRNSISTSSNSNANSDWGTFNMSTDDLGLGNSSSFLRVLANAETDYNTLVCEGDELTTYITNNGATLVAFADSKGNVFQVSAFAAADNLQALNDVGASSDLIMSNLDPSLTQDDRGSIMNTLTEGLNAGSSAVSAEVSRDGITYTFQRYTSNSNVTMCEFSATPVT